MESERVSSIIVLRGYCVVSDMFLVGEEGHVEQRGVVYSDD